MSDEMRRALDEDAAKIVALGGDPGPTFEDGSHHSPRLPAAAPEGARALQPMTLERACAIAAKAHDQVPDDREWLEHELLKQLRELHGAGSRREARKLHGEGT